VNGRQENGRTRRYQRLWSHGTAGPACGWESEELEFVHINEISTDAAGSAHLLKFDSVHGTRDHDGHGEGESLFVDAKNIEYTRNATISETDWSGCDIVIEATGKHHLVTAASCTTNCLVPVVKVMHEKAGIAHGCMTTIHDITNTQIIVDKGHKDLRRARACGNSLIPATTGSKNTLKGAVFFLGGLLLYVIVSAGPWAAWRRPCSWSTSTPGGRCPWGWARRRRATII